MSQRMTEKGEAFRIHDGTAFPEENKKTKKFFQKVIDKPQNTEYYFGVIPSSRSARRCQYSIPGCGGSTPGGGWGNNFGRMSWMVLEKVKMILSSQFDVEEESITPDTNIADDLGADSLDVVDMLMSLEDEFDVEIPDEEIERIRTVGELVAYIEENM